MTTMGICILLGVLLCVSLLAIIILCGMMGDEMATRLEAERTKTKLEAKVDDLSTRLTKYRIQAFWAKENAASGTNTDDESK